VAQTDQTDQPATLEAALRYASGGLRVIPIAPGRKHPPVNEWQKVATTDLTIITSWWTGLYRGHGVGIVTGEASSVWVLDIDVADGKQGAASLAELEDAYGPLPATVEAITGSGGRHLFFAWDPAHPIRNEQAGKIGDGIDVRGEGGQVVAAPTVHPTTRRAYAFRPGHAFGEIAVAPAPGWLYAMREREPEPAPTPPRPSRPTTTHDEADSAAAAFNASTTWDQLLTRDGWTLDKTMGSGEQRWRRPGKNRRGDISATVGHAGRDVLKVFTSSVPALVQDKAYSRFGYEAAVNWGGDRSGFARHLRQQMNDDARADRDDLSWAISDTPAALFAPPADERADDAGAGDADVSDEWPDPEPLEPALGYGPPFPVDVLPTWMGDMAIEIAEALLVPADLPAIAILGALSTAVMTKATLHATGTTWTEDTNLYLMCGYPSGGGKSPAFAAAMAPIEAFEQARIDELSAEIDEATTRHEILTKKAKDKQESAAKGSIDIEEAIRARAEASAVVIPPSPAFIAEDATPEALGQHIAECGGVGALLSSEGDVVDMMAGQYAERGKGANQGVWLKSWGGESIRVKRVGRGVVRLPKSTLTMCVMPQPILLRRLGENAELGERGLTARFLYSVPPSNVGHRDYRSLLRPADDTVREVYANNLTALAERSARCAYPLTLRTTPAATDLFIEWLNLTEARLRAGRDLEGMSGWIAKLRAQTLRIAALLHIAEGRGQQDEIDEHGLARAFVLADYFIEHSKAIHAVWNVGSNPVLQRARKIIEWVIREGITTFTASDLQSKQRRNFEVIKDTVEPLTWLVEAGWLRAESGLPIRVGQRGLSSPSFVVRPDVKACANGAEPVDGVVPAVDSDGAELATSEGAASSSAPSAHSRSVGPVRGPLEGPDLYVRYKTIFQDLSIYLLTSRPSGPSENTGGALRECADGAELPTDEPSPPSTPPSVTEPAGAALPAESAPIELVGVPAPLEDPDDDEDWNLL
jgi:replicative DNA helicase